MIGFFEVLDLTIVSNEHLRMKQVTDDLFEAQHTFYMELKLIVVQLAVTSATKEGKFETTFNKKKTAHRHTLTAQMAKLQFIKGTSAVQIQAHANYKCVRSTHDHKHQFTLVCISYGPTQLMR